MIEEPAVEAVLLDVDGTLLTTGEAMQAAGVIATQALWPDLPGEDAAAGATVFRRDPDGWFASFTRGEVGFEQMRAGRLQVVADALGRSLPQDHLRLYEDAFRPAFESALHVFDDVLPFLDRCRAAGLGVGLLTNSSTDYTMRKLDAVGLTGLLGPVVTRDTLGYGKPDARVFHHACALLRTEPERTAYVGDELEPDALGSHAAGLQPWWLLRAGIRPIGAPDVAPSIRIVQSLAEVEVAPQPPSAGLVADHDQVPTS